MKFLFTAISVLTSKMPSIKFSLFALLTGSVFVFLGITPLSAKSESNSSLNFISESYLSNSEFGVSDDFKIVKVNVYNESVEGNEDGSFIIFLEDKETEKVEERTGISYKLSFKNVSTGKVVTMEKLRTSPLRVTGLVPGEYTDLTVTRLFGTTTTTAKHNDKIVIRTGFAKPSENSFYSKNIKPIFDKYKKASTNLFEHDLIPRKYSLINFKDDNLEYYFRDNNIEFRTKDRSKVFRIVFGQGCQLNAGQKIGEARTKPIENEGMRNVLQANNLTVYNYRDIWYKNILNKIDLHLSSNEEGDLTFRYICLPGSNPSSIKHNIVAATPFNLTTTENNLAVGEQFVELEGLRAFQNIDGRETEVSVQFSSKKSNGFTISVTGSYDKGQPLIVETISKNK